MPKNKMVGKIILPDTVKSISKQRWGRVAQVGAGTKEYPMQLKVGDRVCYLNKEGRIEVDGMILMNQEDVLYIDKEDSYEK